MSDTTPTRASTMLSQIQDRIAGRLPPPPIATLIGFKVIAAAPGAATVTLEAGPQHANPTLDLHDPARRLCARPLGPKTVPQVRARSLGANLGAVRR